MSKKKVGNLVSDKIDLSRHVEIDLAASFRQIKKSGTCRSQTSFEQKKVGDLVSDKSYDKSCNKIDLMEFGLYEAVQLHF